VPLKSYRNDLTSPIFEYAYATGPVSTDDTSDLKILKINDEEKSDLKEISRKENFDNTLVPNNIDNPRTNNITYDTSSNLNISFTDGQINDSILNFTKHVRKNINSAKQDFDNFLRRTENLKIDDSESETLPKQKRETKKEMEISTETDDEHRTVLKNTTDTTYDVGTNVPVSTKTYVPKDSTNSTQLVNDTAVSDIRTYADVLTSTKNTPEDKQAINILKKDPEDSFKNNDTFLQDSLLTSNENEYKKILTSIISSINKLHTPEKSPSNKDLDLNSTTIQDIKQNLILKNPIEDKISFLDYIPDQDDQLTLSSPES